MKVKFIFLILAVSVSVLSKIHAEYQISGHVNLSENWQRQIFLSTIDKLDNYYKADPSNIIQVGSINEDGSFLLNGDNLPLAPRFYRLYLIKEENTEFDACMYIGGNDHNFIHIILDNNTHIEIETDQKGNSPFSSYMTSGSSSNNQLRSLSELVFPSFYFHEIKFPSELQFSKQKLNRDLFHFADTCKNPLVSLAALINTDMDQYYEAEAPRYLSFAERLSDHHPNHDYTENYFRKLNYHKGSTSIKYKLPLWSIILIIFLIIALITSLWKIKSLLNQKPRFSNHNNGMPDKKIVLTLQEEKIFNLIKSGKSNKEIAAELFIELSTVKTHINKLYKKLDVKNRNEARLKAESSINIGG